ncbi:MAG: glycosyltransferase family 2 protein [Chloroflexi bacterium]|nr:glycosyltransferase family 2 protein [Chloroflexota bacterium]
MSIAEIIFWVSAALIVYPYAVFPALVYLRGLLFPRPFRSAPVTPSVSMVMSVYNEENDILARLENIRQIDYPAGRFEVVIASDGSTDRTNEILQQYANDPDLGVPLTVLLLDRVGKAQALNAAVAQAGGEILVFTDANSLFAPDAVRKLVEPFADRAVGGVAGNQVYRSSKKNNLSESGEKSYWNFDRTLKTWESRAGNVISATGSIYAVRRELVTPIIDGVTDDFYTSTVVIEQGYRLVFAPEAVSVEGVTPDAEKEFRRKVRIITRGLRAVAARRGLLNPFRYGFYAVQLFSHKVARRLVVFPLITAFISNLFLLQSGLFYVLAAAAQIAFYAAALLGFFARRSSRKILKPVKIPFFFALVNAASLVAAVNILRGNQIASWVPHRAQKAGAAAAVASAAAGSGSETEDFD